MQQEQAVGSSTKGLERMRLHQRQPVVSHAGMIADPQCHRNDMLAPAAPKPRRPFAFGPGEHRSVCERGQMRQAQTLSRMSASRRLRSYCRPFSRGQG